MSNIEEILWNVFTFYSLNGNPRDPSRLHNTQLARFCKDVMATDSTMTEVPLTSADIHLIYAATLSNPSKVRAKCGRPRAEEERPPFLQTCCGTQRKRVLGYFASC